MRPNRVLYMHRAVHTHAGMQGNSVYELKTKVHLQVSPLSTWKRTQRAGYSSREFHTIELIQVMVATLSW